MTTEDQKNKKVIEENIKNNKYDQNMLSLEIDELDTKNKLNHKNKIKQQVNSAKPNGKSQTYFGYVSVLLFIILGSCLLYGSYQLYNLEKFVAELQTKLITTQQNLQKVTGVINQTDEVINQSGDKVNTELKRINFEIRKLWDLANKRNKVAIAEQQKNIDAMAKTVNTNIKKLVDDINNLQNNSNSNLANLEKKVLGENKAISLQVSALQEEFNKVSAATKKLNKLFEQSDIDDQSVSKQLVSLNEAVKSIDAFRQQINRRLIQAENSIRKLSTDNS